MARRHRRPGRARHPYLHDPAAAFYVALAAYNAAHPEEPLFFIQGVWIPEEEFLATGNAYDPSVTRGFESEIDDAVAVVHGDATLPERRGHASGAYRSDVSRWLLAFSIGVEWDPHAVESTDKLNADTPPYKGRYFTAHTDATPMESWIASMLDHTAARDAGAEAAGDLVVPTPSAWRRVVDSSSERRS